MKIAWIILIISALTDFIINAGTSLMSAMVATGNASLPSKAVLILAMIGGLVQMARTLQHALHSDQFPEGKLLSSDPPAPISSPLPAVVLPTEKPKGDL